MFFQFALIAILVACVLYDLIEFRIPNALSATVAVLFLPWALLHPLPLTQIGGCLFVAATIFVCLGIAFQLGLLGGGDVKLLAATCLWAGPYGFLAHLMLTSIFAAGL